MATVVPFTLRVAPPKGLPASSVTVPEMFFSWAKVAKETISTIRVSKYFLSNVFFIKLKSNVFNERYSWGFIDLIDRFDVN
ncbi:hypothetical protein GCM10011516_11580 [Sphingobacterium cellulitidis]|uniref:Uncharacterized protein n=1 Tax=Sphingobacterium cellulitidis TaxID=1768011 RepID=A0A8H9KUZ0_9SPHI|nr:hypothetical protein GCM10011516_11580 [Sphingobacterium soli]